jgi:hypothetical protein
MLASVAAYAEINAMPLRTPLHFRCAEARRTMSHSMLVQAPLQWRFAVAHRAAQ